MCRIDRANYLVCTVRYCFASRSAFAFNDFKSSMLCSLLGRRKRNTHILDGLLRGAFGDERVAARLFAVSVVSDVFGCVGVYVVGLVVNDDEFAILLEEQVNEAFKHALSDGRRDKRLTPVAPGTPPRASRCRC